MSTATFTKVDYSLNNLIEKIDLGEIGLPDIQRPFVWTPAKVRDLFDSMYKGFPVGYFLFWVNNQADGVRQIGEGGKQDRIPRLLIVDGQQRLTSLYAVLKGIAVQDQEYKHFHIQIAFRPRDAKFEVCDAAIQRDPEFIPDISKMWTEFRTSYKAISWFIQHLNRAMTEEEERQISESIDSLFDLQSYPFTAMEISPSVSEEQVADIFVRINSAGVQLRQADFILTLLSVFWDEGRALLERFSRDSRHPSENGKPSPYNNFIQPAPDQLLRTSIVVGFRRARLQQVYSILRGKDLDTELFSVQRRTEQFEHLKNAQAQVLNLENWHNFMKVLLRAGFRSKSMISSEIGVIYSYAMFLIGKYSFGVDPHILQIVIARWFFMTSMTGRYSNSPETRMDDDLSRLRGMTDANEFINALNKIIDSEITNDFWDITLPTNLETSAARSPYLFAYYASLNLLGARVLFSNIRVTDLLDPAIRSNRSSLERHHLFPKAYLKKLGYDTVRDQNQAANFALIEWGDNLEISDASPSEYFPQIAARFSDSDLTQMMWWHALSEDWYMLDYPTFLSERRKSMANVTRHGFETLVS